MKLTVIRIVNLHWSMGNGNGNFY